ncbi:Nrap protein [Aspergillus leporis]|jgi:U3 small nucleolar RNA-associated protein 22|uniref:U3 small nucleolar RNA-associated protein 22 n=1 Tax=Aspergillus leporis TaxID=41062 RepID=A0A5N5X9B4_9EURO|nr:Nrap protein [Aspergillus leporis]
MSAHIVKKRKLSPPPQTTQQAKQPQASSQNDAPKMIKSEVLSMNSMTRRGKNDRSAELALASGLYKSSFFKLQLDELLTDSRPNYDKHVSRLQETLHKLKKAIEHIPGRPSKLASEAEKDLRSAHGVIVPYPEPRPGKDTKYSVSYSKPTNVNVVGSFALRTGVRTSEPYTVDLAVTMPSTLFQEKDYVNYRFFHKRAYYIACLAAGIKEAEDLNFDIKFALQDGDSLRPTILLEPTDSAKDGPKTMRSQIRIITAIEDHLFPIARTLPMKNNVRQGSTDRHEYDEPTSFYNAALRSEATVSPFHKLLYSAAQNCDSFRDACILGRIWLRQRGFGSSFQRGGFGGFEWTVLMSLLFEGGGLNGKPVLLKSYSSYQLFKATLQFLAGRNLITPLLLFASDIPSPSGIPMLYDGKRGLNILYRMSPWSYSFLRHEASITLKMLNESRDDNFQKVFIYKVDHPMLRFDRLVALPTSDNGNVLRTIHNHTVIYEVLRKALGDRAELISLFSHGAAPWSVEKKPSAKATNATLYVGLSLNPENAMRVVDHGPFAEQKEEAATFRSFWGEKAELRRFKDGTIRESLVWSDQPSSSSIVYQLLIYVLQRHFNYVENEIRFIGDEYDEKLRNSGDGILSYSSSPFQLITDAFNSLQKSFQELDDVPLTVRHLAPASPLMRYSALRVQSVPGVIREPVDIVLQFESSSRWPDDLVAIQMTKVAFLIKIGDSLVSSGTASSCKVGLENESSRILNNAFLDISHTSSVVFRLRIHHDREQILLERQLKEKEVSPQAKQEVAYALSAYKRLFIQSPRLTQAIRTLCTRFPLMSPTIRLVKDWFNSHLFTCHINEELVELLVVRVFTQPYPWDNPSSVMVGFLRTLHLLSRWDWQQEPLVIDLGGELDQDAIQAIRTRFSAWRSVDPAMNTVALFAASDMDPDGVTWTQYEMPPKVIAARMSMLAKAGMKLVRENDLNLDVSDLFHTSLAPYDFIVNLRSKVLRDDHPASLVKYKNLNGPDAKDRSAKVTLVRSFVRDLQACFSPNILFFHGDENCDVIAGLWNPQATKSKSWSLKMTYSSSPTILESSRIESAEASINRDAILNEISRLGGALVDNIQILGAE